MIIKLVGAGMIVLGCGCFGYSMAFFHRREEDNLRQLISALDWMEMELPSTLSPLPILCAHAANQVSGPVHDLLSEIAERLNLQMEPDAQTCVSQLVESVILSDSMKGLFLELGATLGRFDLPGQLQGLRAVKMRASLLLHGLEENRTARLRSYQTLGLCAGASLAILLL